MSNPHMRTRWWQLVRIMGPMVVGVSTLLWGYWQQVNLFVTPDQLLTRPAKNWIRVGAQVKPHSLQLQHGEHASIVFQARNPLHAGDIEVRYAGALPNLFKEGSMVVIEGNWDGHGVLRAQRVLAKHDENYQPPQGSGR